MNSDTPAEGGYTAQVGAPTGSLNVGGSATANINTGIISRKQHRFLFTQNIEQ